MKRIIVIAEHDSGKISPITWELVAAAGQLALPASLVMTGGAGDEPVARELAQRSGLDTVLLRGGHLEVYSGAACKTALADWLRGAGPCLVLAGHTARGLDFAPGLAVRLGAACVSGVEAMEMRADGPALTRRVHGDKLAVTLACQADLAVVTLQPGCWKADPPRAAATGRVEVIQAAESPGGMRTTGREDGQAAGAALLEAEVVVSGGRGLGKPENVELLSGLAALFARSAVGGSRPICDLGWMDYRNQVGQTGATVSPKLYVACGISGARQHTMGMQGSGFVVAINSDSGAAIFEIADLGVVEDLTVFIPELVAQAKAS